MTGLSGDVAQPLTSAISGELCSQKQTGENSTRPPMKLKLQFFPIDEVTRKVLERDECNPHLELTLSARKRISSILEHLNRKWGDSSIASGELMLLPSNICVDNITSCPRWTLMDTAASAGDVYASIGSPAIFRLRYGWFSNLECSSAIVSLRSSAHHFSSCIQTKNIEDVNVCVYVPPDKFGKDSAVGPCSPDSLISDQLVAHVEPNLTSAGTTVIHPAVDMQKVMIDGLLQSKNKHAVSVQQVDDSPRLSEVTVDVEEQEDMENVRNSVGAPISAGEWANSLTNISVGDLLSEASRIADPYPNNLSAWGRASCLQHLSLSCESFDAAIAGLLSRHQDTLNLSMRASPASILDAEETCDEFSFRKVLASNRGNLDPPSNFSTGDCRLLAGADSNGYQSFLKDFAAAGEPSNDPPHMETSKLTLHMMN